MRSQYQFDRQTERTKEAVSREELQRLFRVIIHNDEVTPYDFVIVILVRFFQLDAQAAELVTWTAHTTGKAQVSVLPFSEAQRRVGKARFAANLEGYPLLFTIEHE